MIFSGIQAAAAAIGENGCYFFSLGKAVGFEGDMLEEYRAAVASEALSATCFVNDAAKILAQLTGSRWDVVKAGPGHPLPLTYCPRPGEREILRFERPDPEGGDPLAHFVLGDGQGRCLWDPWGESETVRVGIIVSKRILRRL